MEKSVCLLILRRALVGSIAEFMRWEMLRDIVENRAYAREFVGFLTEYARLFCGWLTMRIHFIVTDGVDSTGSAVKNSANVDIKMILFQDRETQSRLIIGKQDYFRGESSFPAKLKKLAGVARWEISRFHLHDHGIAPQWNSLARHHALATGCICHSTTVERPKSKKGISPLSLSAVSPRHDEAYKCCTYQPPPASARIIALASPERDDRQRVSRCPAPPRVV
nr:hypothetical protein CFP56_13472 [Quercus suber]